jgi:hypothetical protein
VLAARVVTSCLGIGGRPLRAKSCYGFAFGGAALQAFLRISSQFCMTVRLCTPKISTDSIFFAPHRSLACLLIFAAPIYRLVDLACVRCDIALRRVALGICEWLHTRAALDVTKDRLVREGAIWIPITTLAATRRTTIRRIRS